MRGSHLPSHNGLAAFSLVGMFSTLIVESISNAVNAVHGRTNSLLAA